MDAIERRMLARLYVTLAVTLVVLVPMLLFWDTSGNTVGRLVVGGFAACLTVADTIIVVRFVQERWGRR